MTQRTVKALTGTVSWNNQQPAQQADNGNLWMAGADWGAYKIAFSYSTDKGTTWNYVSAMDFGISFPQSVSIFIVGSKIWFVSNSLDNNPYNSVFGWGTLNAGRTDLTSGWGWAYVDLDYSDYQSMNGLQVHTEGSGYKAHIIRSKRYYNNAVYTRLSLDSSGAYSSTDVDTSWSNHGNEGTHYSNIHLDSVTKDLHLVASVSGGGTYLVEYQKRAYSGATWPAGTVRTLFSDSSYAANFSSAFDGDRTVVAYFDDSNTNTPCVLERDKADTTTTSRTPPSGVSGSTALSTQMAIQTNAQKDILLVFQDSGTDPTDIYKNTFTRLTTTWSGATLVRDTAPNVNAYNFAFIKGTKYFFFRGD